MPLRQDWTVSKRLLRSVEGPVRDVNSCRLRQGGGKPDDVQGDWSVIGRPAHDAGQCNAIAARSAE